jgi:hypothetical protein
MKSKYPLTRLGITRNDVKTEKELAAGIAQNREKNIISVI